MGTTGLTNWRRRSGLLMAVLVVVAGWVSTPVSAWAASTTLCSDYGACGSAGRGDGGYGGANGTSYWGMYTGHNCTNYAAYRLIHNGVDASYLRGHGNAFEWGSQAAARGVVVDSQPAVGAIAWWPADTAGAGSSGHVAYVEEVGTGFVVVSEDNWGGTFHWKRLTPGGYYPPSFIHFKDTVTSPPADGSYILAPDTGRVYVMAGRSPMWVTSWNSVGGQHPISATYPQSAIDQMPRFPLDGTGLRNPLTGEIFTVAGGFGFRLTGLGAIPNPTWVEVDGWAIQHQLRTTPVDGTTVRNQFTGGIYVVAGNSPMPVYNLANVPYTTWTNVDPWAIDNQLQRYPSDGSMIVDHSTGVLHVIAGGSAMPATAMENIPPVTSVAFVDHSAIPNRLRPYPADGTVVRGYTTGAISVIAGGAPLGVASLQGVPYTHWVDVDNWAITQLPTSPTDGTHVRSYGTGKVYRVQDGIAHFVPAWGPSGPQPTTDVDQWAITNQLHAID